MTKRRTAWSRGRLLPALLLAGVLAAAFPLGAGASSPPAAAGAASFFLDGKRLSDSLDTFVEHGALFVPARPVLEALGFDIEWSQDKGQVGFRRHGTRAAFRVGVAGVVVNGEFRPLPVAPAIRADRTYVPLVLLQVAGEKVYWDPVQRAVTARRPHLAPTAVLESAQGAVTVSERGRDPGRPAVPGTTLRPGDVIETAAGASARVGLDDGSLLEVAPGSRLEVRELRAGSADASRRVSFRLFLGRVLVRVSKLIHKNSSFELETPTGVVGVRGTIFLVEVREDGRSLAAVLSGRVAVSGGAGERRQAVLLEQRQETVIEAPGAPPVPPRFLKDVTVDAWAARAVEEAVLRQTEDGLAPEVPDLREDKVKEKASGKLEEARKALERAKLRKEKGDEAVPEPEDDVKQSDKDAQESGKGDGKKAVQDTGPGEGTDDRQPGKGQDTKEQPLGENQEPEGGQQSQDEGRLKVGGEPVGGGQPEDNPQPKEVEDEHDPWPKREKGEDRKGEEGGEGE